MTSSLGVLRQNSSDASKDSALMLELARQTSKDAQTLNAFSTVATAYLPVSLIAVSTVAAHQDYILTCSIDDFQLEPHSQRW